jgi:peroxiredoxin
MLSNACAGGSGATSRESTLEDAESTARVPAKAQSPAKRETVPLSSRLSEHRDKTQKLRPAFAKAYDDLVERLDVLDRGGVGPGVGEPMPPFDLSDENGNLVSLASLLRHGPAVISFNRGHWCPYCRLELRALAAVNDRMRKLGARVVSIMPDSGRYTAHYVKNNELPFPILSDIDLGYSLSLGLIFWVGAEVRRLYKEVGIELEKYHGNDGFFLPVTAKFIVGQDGLVKARHVNIEFRERMEPEAIITVLEELRAGANCRS